jgi:hypothetical protein
LLQRVKTDAGFVGDPSTFSIQYLAAIDRRIWSLVIIGPRLEIFLTQVRDVGFKQMFGRNYQD